MAFAAHQSPNGNRFKHSQTAHLVLNIETLPPEKQIAIPKSLTQKVKLKDGTEIPSHVWLTQEQINAVASNGLPDIQKADTKHPAINSFAQSTIQASQSMIPEIRANVIEKTMIRAGFSAEVIQQFFAGIRPMLESPTEAQINFFDWISQASLQIISGRIFKNTNALPSHGMLP